MQSILILLNKLNEGGRQDHTMQNLSDGILLAQILDNYFNTDNKNVLFQAIYDNLNKLRTQSQQDCQHYTAIDQHFIRYFLETIIQCNTAHVLDIIKSLSELDQKIIVNFLQNQSNLDINDGYYTTILVDQLDKLQSEKESLIIHHNQLAQSQEREIQQLQAIVAELNTEFDSLRDSQITFLQSVNEQNLNDVKEKYLKNTMELLEIKELMRKQKIANESNQQLISKLEQKLNEHQSDEKKNVRIEQVLIKDPNTQLQLDVLKQKLQAQQDQFKQQVENFLIEAETKQNMLNCKISECKLEIDDQKKIIQQLNYENDDLRKDNQQLEENYNDIERQLRDFTINQQKPEILETLRQQDIKSCNNSVYYTEIDTIIRPVPTPKGNFESMFSKTISKFEADVNQHRVTQVEIKSNREIILEKTINELKRKFKQLEKQQLIFCKKAEEDIKVFSEKCESYVQKINEQKEEIKQLTQSYNSEYISQLNKQCVEQSEYIVQMSQMLMNKPKVIRDSGKNLQMKQLRIIERRRMRTCLSRFLYYIKSVRSQFDIIMSKYQYVLEGKYGIVKVVGKGEFGEVYMAENLMTVLALFMQGQEVAIKQALKQELERVKKRQELFQTEKRIMEMIRNENVISLLDHIETKEKHYLVMEYCNQGDLDSYVKSIKAQTKKPLPEEQAKNFLKQLLNGFKGLHELFVIHRDLKLKNILVHNGTLKIADFGLSKLGELGVTHVGTPYTKAPEVFKGRGRIRYNNKADIWSLGVIFYQLLFDLRYPFNGQNEKDLFDNIERARDLNFNPKGINVQITDDAKRLLRQMLTKDSALRISWAELYSDSYLDFGQKEQKEATQFDPLYQEVMTKFQVIRGLQLKIQETMGNSELLRTEYKAINNLNQYYVQFILSKRIMGLSRTLGQLIGSLKQQPRFLTKALLEIMKETEDSQFVYQMYYENVKQNLEGFLNRRKQQKKEFEIEMVQEISNRNLNWGVFMKVCMNYYICLNELAILQEGRNQMKALQLYDHIIDVLRCLENDSAFEGEKLKQKSQSQSVLQQYEQRAMI